MELGLGYQGGINAFVTFALGYNIDLEQMALDAWDNIPADVITESVGFVEWLQKKGQSWPMSHTAAVVCNAFKTAWRNAHPKTVQLWAGMDHGFKIAVTHPGTTHRYGRFVFRRDGAWVRILLPSGRCLVYPNPEVDNKGQASYMGVNQYTRKWQRIKTYGGRLSENITQSVARDFLFDNLRSVDDAGYAVIMRVHDELISETPDTEDFSATRLSELLSVVPSWGEGMPLAAAGFEAYRYRK